MIHISLNGSKALLPLTTLTTAIKKRGEEMNNINYVKIKIIEEETPDRAEYEINDFIQHCRKNSMQVLDITSHINTDAEANYCYTFIIKYKK